ncbi:ArsR/SmtB family transcription factor [Nocardia fusca]|uniref:ArsR/SmtB family transcription factor n=1 Tax=Nocardia fusca TaxID=941183 RepID=UPI0037C9BEB1
MGEIAAKIGLSQPAVSHHLKILRAARLLTVERRGTLRFYTLNGAELTDLLAPLRTRGSDHLLRRPARYS